MENATKALLIAASVLVVILLISLGIGVFTSAEEQMGNADLSEYQVQQFNQKFTKFQGSQSGSEVNALIETVFNHNMQQTEDSMCVELKANGKSVLSRSVIKKDTAMPTKVSTAKTFNVTVTLEAGTGRVKTIDYK